jgi:hypothetical protein
MPVDDFMTVQAKDEIRVAPDFDPLDQWPVVQHHHCDVAGFNVGIGEYRFASWNHSFFSMPKESVGRNHPDAPSQWFYAEPIRASGIAD